MTDETQAVLDRFLMSFSAGVAPLLLLDYDGTLAPFRVDRLKASPFRGVRRILARIQSHTGTRIVLITGRSAKEASPAAARRPACR